MSVAGRISAITTTVKPQSHHRSTTTSSATILPLRHPKPTTTHASLRSTFLTPIRITPITPTTRKPTTRKPTSIEMSMEAGVGLMGTKLGMITYFESTGKVVPVTVIGFREGNIVTQVKIDETDGYNAVQVGYRRVRDKKLTKPETGHLEKAGVIPLRHLQEFRLQSVDGFEPNQKLVLEELFKEGHLVDVSELSGTTIGKGFQESPSDKDLRSSKKDLISMAVLSSGSMTLFTWANPVAASEYLKMNPVYEVGELFELGIQLSYLLLLLGLLGVGTFFIIRQVLVRRELDLSAKELQEQVRSGDASSMELFELGAVMLRRKFYPAATKYLLQAIDKWDGDEQDLAQVYNALGVSYVRDGKTDKGISQLETAVKIQPGYVTAWNNLGDAYEKKKEYKSALKAFEEALLFDPNNTVARPRRDALLEKVQMYKGVPFKSKQR